ncbi:MAG: helix-hairpin-helix domain-containing protein [Peribacillus sp.]|uniref:helix-hairpin-helix domain-containing protein n=1 Tax=Peribacillus sp. NPDC097225 TaxID=3364400 RepID=UPI00380F653E
METILKKKLTVVAVAIVIVVIGFYLFFQPEDETAGTEDIFAASANEEMEEETKPEAESEPRIMKVDVKGAVRAPGVFTAQAGDRVIDLITEAGSFTDKADMDKVNLAQLVEDQMVIYVPKIGEEDVEGPANVATAPTGSMASEGASSSTGGQVNLNAATQADLETLSGIGPSKATAILEYRETIGKFKQVEDLKNVSGIGDKTFEKLKDSITVQ